MKYKAIVRVTGGKDSFGIQDQDFTWTGDNAKDVFGWATNFAEGYARALASIEDGIVLYCPAVKQFDGYHWWERHSEFKVQVVNKDGKVVCKWEDLV